MSKVDNFLKRFIMYFLKLTRIHPDEDRIISCLQFVKFAIVGVTNTVISYGLNILVLVILKPFHLSWDYIAGNVVAFFLSVLWSFYWNNRFVFTIEDGKKRNLVLALLKTYVAYGFTGIILNNVLSYLWVTKLGISKYIAPLINLVISVPVNFMINKFWAFKTDE